MHLKGRVWRIALLGAAVAVGPLSTPVTAGSALAVTPDGFFKEWKKLAPAASDAVGDGRAGGIDLGRLYLANDAEALYLRLEIGAETILQNPIGEPAGNRLRLLLDLDNTASTGRPVEGLGVEVEVRFGERSLLAYDASGVGVEQPLGGSGVMMFTTNSAVEFELRVPFAAALSQGLVDQLAEGGELALVLAEESSPGDRLPDFGTLLYQTSPEPTKSPKSIRLRKKKAHFVRLLTFNVERSTIASKPELYSRILSATSPDLIAFQEVLTWNADQTRGFVAEALPLEPGRQWEAFQVADTVTVSSFPILAGAAVDENSVVHIDLPDDRTQHDLVLFNAHTPCCSNESSRDFEHDRLMATWRDLLEGAGPFAIDFKDLVILVGDFNMVGFRRQLAVLLHGIFIDPANGPNFSPGRGRGSLRSAPLRHSHLRRVHTWRRSSSSFGAGKLDYVIFSNDVAKLKKKFILDTETIPDEVLESFGLQRDDSLEASDHLALVTDFRLRRN